jgi:hypothetical protein
VISPENKTIQNRKEKSQSSDRLNSKNVSPYSIYKLEEKQVREVDSKEFMFTQCQDTR